MSAPERVPIAVVIPRRGSRVLVARRPPGAHLAGLWEFPGGKIEDGETPEACARRELLEEMGLVAGRLDPLVVLFWDYPDRALRIHVFVADEVHGEANPREGSAAAWVGRDELESLEMPEANGAMLRALRWRTEGGPAR